MAAVTNIPPEAQGEEDFSVPEDWPHAGEIVCEQLAVRYASDLPLVLQGVSFAAKVSPSACARPLPDGLTKLLQPGERVCIVGRTGGGKSDLAHEAPCGTALIRYLLPRQVDDGPVAPARPQRVFRPHHH